MKYISFLILPMWRQKSRIGDKITPLNSAMLEIISTTSRFMEPMAIFITNSSHSIFFRQERSFYSPSLFILRSNKSPNFNSSFLKLEIFFVKQRNNFGDCTLV